MLGVRAICMFDSDLYISRMHLLPCNAQVQVFNYQYTIYHKIMYIIQVKGLEYMFTFHLCWFWFQVMKCPLMKGRRSMRKFKLTSKKERKRSADISPVNLALPFLDKELLVCAIKYVC